MSRVGVQRRASPADLPVSGVTKLWLVASSSVATALKDATTGPQTQWVRPDLGRIFEGLDRVLASATASPGMKRLSLEWLAEREGIGLDEMVAVGDHDNDLEALQAAGLAVAVESSSPQILAIADRVIGGPGTGGVAELLIELAG